MVIYKSFFESAYDFYDKDYMGNINDINKIMDMYEARVAQQNILTAFGMITEAADDSFTESAVDAVRNLGEKILEMIKKFKEFVVDILGKIKGTKLKRQALGKEIIRLEAKNPELAEKVKVAITAGDIDFASMKGISEYYKEVDKIVDDIEKGKLDPKSFRGRLQRAKKFILDNKETVAGIAALLGLAGTITGLYVNIRKQKSAEEHEETEIEEIQKRAVLSMEKTQKQVAKLQSLPPEKQPVTAIGFYANVVAEIDKETKAQISKREKMLAKIAGKMDNAVKKVYEKLNIKSDYASNKNKDLTNLAIRKIGVTVDTISTGRNIANANFLSKSDAERHQHELDVKNAVKYGRTMDAELKVTKKKKKRLGVNLKSDILDYQDKQRRASDEYITMEAQKRIYDLDKVQRELTRLDNQNSGYTKEDKKIDLDTELAQLRIDELKNKNCNNNNNRHNNRH